MAKSKKVSSKKVVAPGEAPVVVAAAPVPVTAANRKSFHTSRASGPGRACNPRNVGSSLGTSRRSSL